MGVRNAILEYLNLASNQAEQLEYEKSVPVADVPAELICGFADDLFHPHSKQFLAEFSAEEVKDLAEFYGRLCVASDAINDRGVKGVKEMLMVPEWRSVMSHAKQLRARLEQRN